MNKKGVLLLNLGTPDAPDVKHVRRYLSEFLTDRRVITLPWPLRYLLVYSLILPIRPFQSARNYQKIWTEQGSPLLYISQNSAQKLQQVLGSEFMVELGMRYGNPSIATALDKLSSCESLTILPLYPQYASSSTGSALEQTLSLISRKYSIPTLKIINSYYNHPAFIESQAALIRPYQNRADHILFSYHGLPESHLKDSGCKTICNVPCPAPLQSNPGCYRSQCFETSRQLAKTLDLTESQYTTSFQSRLGKTPWIRPYTDDILSELAQQGIKRLAVSCPSFTVDCLETLEEIGMAAKNQWMELGGTSFELIPALNDNDSWILGLSQIISFN